METTLVLDVSYRPVSCASWQNAIVWVLERVADVVEEYPDRYIRTVKWQVNMPSVVRLLKPICRKRAIKFSRSNVYLRDGGKCGYCGRRVFKDNWTYDHVVPRAQGGKTDFNNVVVCCYECNQYKGGRTPEQAGMVLKVKPVKPKKLPDVGLFDLEYRPGMPEGWRGYLRDTIYWKGELEHD